MTNRQQLAWNGEEKIVLEAVDANGVNIKPSTSAKILGLQVTNNMTWTNHLEKGREAILVNCRKKLGALKFAARNQNKSDRKRLGDAVIMSRLTYAIQVWGLNIRTSILNKVQQVQNLTACWISSKPRWTRTSELLDSVGWLSIYQLAFYYTFLTIWKIKLHL